MAVRRTAVAYSPPPADGAHTAQETIVVHLGRYLLFPLDDLLTVMREFLSSDVALVVGSVPAAPRRGQLECSQTEDAQRAAQDVQELRAGLCAHGREVPPQMQDEAKRHYLFVAIARATR